MSVWEWLTDTRGFVPRSQCGTGWTSAVITATGFFDVVIFLSYMLIPTGIVRLFWKVHRHEPIRGVKVGAFLAANFVFWCGVTHLSDKLMYTWPAYHLDCATRGVAAVSSFASVLWFSMLDVPVKLSPRGMEGAP